MMMRAVPRSIVECATASEGRGRGRDNGVWVETHMGLKRGCTTQDGTHVPSCKLAFTPTD